MVHEYDDFLTFRDLTDSEVTLFRYQAIDTLQLIDFAFSFGLRNALCTLMAVIPSGRDG